MIYAIGDLHLDYTKVKPMDIFGTYWADHEERLFENWTRVVGSEDTVLVVGDICWGLKLQDAVEDLRRIDALPGRKILSKGNHDYWWSSLQKMEALGFTSLSFLHNRGYRVGDIGVVGTRGWSDIDSKNATSQDEKIYTRELGRLELSYKDLPPDTEKVIAMIHYPPFHGTGDANDFVYYLLEQNIDHCVYGHLHGAGHKYIREGEILGIDFHCVAADYVDFTPVPIMEETWK